MIIPVQRKLCERRAILMNPVDVDKLFDNNNKVIGELIEIDIWYSNGYYQTPGMYDNHRITYIYGYYHPDIKRNVSIWYNESNLKVIDKILGINNDYNVNIETKYNLDDIIYGYPIDRIRLSLKKHENGKENIREHGISYWSMHGNAKKEEDLLKHKEIKELFKD